MRHAYLLLLAAACAIISACIDEPDIPSEKSSKYILAALRKPEKNLCRALSAEGVLWDIPQREIQQLVKLLHEQPELHRHVLLGDIITEKLQQLAKINESDATVLQRATSGAFEMLMRQIIHLDSTVIFSTDQIREQPDTLIIALDLAGKEATIVHISGLRIGDQPSTPPQPIVQNTITTLFSPN